MTIRQVFALISLLAVSTVHADEYVNNADANGDGFVSLYELRAAYYADPEFNQRIENSFAEYDRNGDGLISGDERRVTSGGVGQAVTNTRVGNQKSEAARPVDFSDGELAAKPFTNESVNTAGSSMPAAEREDDSVHEASSSAGSEEKQPGEQYAGSLSRTELWIMEIDADKSGGVSVAELIASGGGKPWFTDREFSAADRNADGDLNAAELDALVSSLERRNR